MIQKIISTVMVLAAWVFLMFMFLAPQSFGQYTLAPVARQQFFTNSGVVAAGYKLCTLAAGTSTALPAYSDYTGTPLNNPITLNSAGRPQTSVGVETGLYLSPAKYKFILYASGTGNTCNGSAVGAQVWSQDQVYTYLAQPLYSATIIGGTASTSTLTLQSTSAAGTTDAVYIKVGNNGATTAATFTTSHVLLGISATDSTSAVVTANSLSAASATSNATALNIWASTAGVSSIEAGATGTGTRLGLSVRTGGTTTALFTSTNNFFVGYGSSALTLTGTGNILARSYTDGAGGYTAVSASGTSNVATASFVTGASSASIILSASGSGTIPQLTVYSGGIIWTAGTSGGGGGIMVGSATGGVKATGTINIAADIYKNNAAYTNPDFVLEHWATGAIDRFKDNPGARSYPGIKPLDQVESFARQYHYLPQLQYFDAHEEPAGMFARSDINLMLHEETFIHLFEHETKLKEADKWLANLEERMTKMESDHTAKPETQPETIIEEVR